MGQESPNFPLIRLSPAAQYGLGAAAHLALQSGSALSGMERIARRRGLPASYLAKIMRRLAEKKIVSSRRGRGGGHTLARPANRITLAEIVRAVETLAPAPRRCLLELRDCSFGTPCVLHDDVVSTEDRLWKVLEKTTLSSYARRLGDGGVEVR